MYIANLLSQNPGVPHGSSFYLRGVAQSRFDAENHKEIFDTYVKLTEGSDLVVGVIWELWSLTKVDSIAPDATAFPGRGQLTLLLPPYGIQRGYTSFLCPISIHMSIYTNLNFQIKAFYHYYETLRIRGIALIYYTGLKSVEDPGGPHRSCDLGANPWHETEILLNLNHCLRGHTPL